MADLSDESHTYSRRRYSVNPSTSSIDSQSRQDSYTVYMTKHHYKLSSSACDAVPMSTTKHNDADASPTASTFSSVTPSPDVSTASPSRIFFFPPSTQASSTDLPLASPSRSPSTLSPPVSTHSRASSMSSVAPTSTSTVTPSHPNAIKGPFTRHTKSVSEGSSLVPNRYNSSSNSNDSRSRSDKAFGGEAGYSAMTMGFARLSPRRVGGDAMSMGRDTLGLSPDVMLEMSMFGD